MRSMSTLLLALVCLPLFAHEHKAPHGGALIVLGDEFAHIELVLDANGGAKVYALDAHAEKAVRLKQKSIEIEYVLADGTKGKLELKGVASALSGETEDNTSEFAGKDDKLKGVKSFDGSVKALKIRGKSFKDVKFNFPKGNE